jgi:heme/copper-type cytochrome/quinol oxidase subunit 2
MSLFLLGYHASFTMVGAWAFIVTAFVIFIVVYRDRKEEEKPKP